jgi:hypothetical protein
MGCVTQLCELVHVSELQVSLKTQTQTLQARASWLQNYLIVRPIRYQKQSMLRNEYAGYRPIRALTHQPRPDTHTTLHLFVST